MSGRHLGPQEAGLLSLAPGRLPELIAPAFLGSPAERSFVHGLLTSSPFGHEPFLGGIYLGATPAGERVEMKRFEITDGYLAATADELRSAAVQTDTHPGFATDWQSPLMVLMTQAEGMSVLHETVFEDRAKQLMVSSSKSMFGHLLGASGGLEAMGRRARARVVARWSNDRLAERPGACVRHDDQLGEQPDLLPQLAVLERGVVAV